MDIMLDSGGDLFVSPQGDISLEDSIAQKIRIKLLWFEGEWRWDEEEGMPYMEHLFDRNPDTDYFEEIAREKIFEITEVTEVREVTVTFDRETRNAAIKFTAVTDYGVIEEEMRIRCQITG